MSFNLKQKGKSVRESRQKKLVLESQPRLEQGVNLIQKPGKLPVFQSLVAPELDSKNANAVWIDSGNESSTYALSGQGSSDILEKVRIGRAFTPFQHHSLVNQLEEFIDEDTSLLVFPNIDLLYLDGQVKEWEAEQLFEESWNRILQLKQKYDLKVLVSASPESQLYYFVSGDSDNKIRVEETVQGWKYSSREFDQMAYHDSGEIQTTIPYWLQKTSEKVQMYARRL